MSPLIIKRIEDITYAYYAFLNYGLSGIPKDALKDPNIYLFHIVSTYEDLAKYDKDTILKIIKKTLFKQFIKKS